ncbi:MAG: BON domain-containing protein [Bryobacterales bacterium]|nr:BON domain-containing protein [Bryobacterales bacterium]
MLHRLRILVCGLLLASGCIMAQSNADDDRIYDQVRMRLANHPDVKGGAIEVEVKDGVVTLQGKVRTDKAKSKADGAAMKVKGVKKVINQLQVTPAAS